MKRLFFAFLGTCLATSLFAQSVMDDSPKKGDFAEVYIPEQTYTVINPIYTADAAKLANEWSGDFSYYKKSFSTGNYVSNGRYTATSPKFQLPNIEDGQKIILSFDEGFQTEYKYDYFGFIVECNGTKDVVYRKSGVNKLAKDYVDLSKYSGQSIQLIAFLAADGSENGCGWRIYNMQIAVSTKGAFLKKRGAAESQQISSINILNVDADKYPTIHVSFTANDANGNFVSGLDLADIKAWNFGKKTSSIGGCENLYQESSSIKPAVDVFFIMDNSGSMRANISNCVAQVSNLVDKLSKQYDLRAGVLRFAFSNKSNNPCPDINSEFIVDDVNSKLWHITDSIVCNEFCGLINDKTIASGWYEPGYQILSYLATYPISYRANTQKVFILMTDEANDNGDNQYDCGSASNKTISYTQASTIALLQSKGIQVFTLTADDSESVKNYKPIAEATGGTWGDVDGQYNDILSNIGSSISQKYIYSYCVENVVYDTIVCIPFKMNVNGQIDSVCYAIPNLGTMVRTKATENLDGIVQKQNQPVTVGVEVCPPKNEQVDSIIFYYRNVIDNEFYSIIQKTSSSDCNVYNFTIPAKDVDYPTIEYKFEVIFSNRTAIASPEGHSSYSTWSFAVDPNYPPMISDVQVSDVENCHEVMVCAKITDNTDFLSKVELHYRSTNSPSTYIPTKMEKCNDCGEDIYCGVIPPEIAKEDGITYYIMAEDNYGSRNWFQYYYDPDTLFMPQYPLSTVNPNQIGIMTSVSSFACEALQIGDTINAYFINDCGDFQFGGSGIVAKKSKKKEAIITIYGDSDTTDNYKNGFINGDVVYLRYVKNGYEYNLELDQDKPLLYDEDLKYSAQNNVSFDGYEIPKITVYGNDLEIDNNSIKVSANNFTDFGTSSSQVTHTFEIQNFGCEILEVTNIFVDDDENFTVNFPSTLYIEPDEIVTFSITYNAKSKSIAKVSIVNNDIPFNFYIKGDVANKLNCSSIQVPNPVTNKNNIVYFELEDDAEVTAKIYSTNGVLEKTIYNNEEFEAGENTLAIPTAKLTKYNAYILRMIVDDTQCSTQFIRQ